MGILSKAHKYLVWFGAAYVIVLISLVHPLVQQELLYLRNVRMVDELALSNPSAFGLSPYSTLNLKLNTSDGERLGKLSYISTVSTNLDSRCMAW